MPTQRTQVDDLRSGIQIQPAADPVDRTIISRAPSITPDPTMNSWNELANDFVRGFGTIKKAQVEADIPMGEQYYMESGIDGLFADGKPDLEVMAKMVQEHKLTEEHSVGTRIGFERAAGRSTAYREQSKITEELDKLIQSAQGVDEKGVPILPTGAMVEKVVADARAKHFGLLRTDPNSQWLVNSPYAAEEYNRLMRSFVPGTTEAYKQKARERLTEQRRVLVTEQAVDMIVNGSNSPDFNQTFGKFIDNEVRLGSIQDPKKFLAETFKIAGLSLLSRNPNADAQGLMRQFTGTMDRYNFNGATMSGIYGLKVKEDLLDAARQQDSQRLADKNLAIRKHVDEDITSDDPIKSLSARLSSGPSSESADDRVSHLIETTQKWIAEQEAAAPDKKIPYYMDVAQAVLQPYLARESLGIKANNSLDKANQDRIIDMILPAGGEAPKFDEARKLANSMLDPSNRATAVGMIRRMQDADLPNLLSKDLTVKASYQAFKATDKIVAAGRSFGNKETGKVTSYPIPLRSGIGNRTIDNTFTASMNEQHQALLNELAVIQSDTTKSQKERSAAMKTVIDNAKDLRVAEMEKTLQPRLTLEQNLRSHEGDFSDATQTILDAFNNDVIDSDSRDKLINNHQKLLKTAIPSRSEFKKIFTEAYLEEARSVIGASGGTELSKTQFANRLVASGDPGSVRQYKLTQAAETEIQELADSVAEQWATAYQTGASSIAGVALERSPSTLLSAIANVRIAKDIRTVSRTIFKQKLQNELGGIK